MAPPLPMLTRRAAIRRLRKAEARVRSLELHNAQLQRANGALITALGRAPQEVPVPLSGQAT